MEAAICLGLEDASVTNRVYAGVVSRGWNMTEHGNKVVRLLGFPCNIGFRSLRSSM